MFHGIRLSLNHDTKVRKNIEICNFSGNFFCMNRVNLNQFLKDKNLVSAKNESFGEDNIAISFQEKEGILEILKNSE